MRFSVIWYEKSFFDERREAFRSDNHLSYFRMFGKSTSDMEIDTEFLGGKEWGEVALHNQSVPEDKTAKAVWPLILCTIQTTKNSGD